MKKIVTLVAGIFLASNGLCQSYSISTGSVIDNSLYLYSFTVNYDQMGVDNPLVEPIWSWKFSIPMDFGSPTEVLCPEGWQFIYDPNWGDCFWFTEGPDGWAAGDFGSHTIAPGASLSGFSFKTPLEPAYGLVVATDTAFVDDYAVATLPQVAPVPEPTSIASVAMGLVCLASKTRKRY